MHDGTGQRISLSCKPWNITLSIGEHYLIQAEFVMFMDHQALKFIIQKKNKNAINQMHTLWVVYIQLGDLYDYRSFQIPMEFPLPTRKQAAFPIKPFILSILLYRENATFTGSFLSQPALTLYLPCTLSYRVYLYLMLRYMLILQSNYYKKNGLLRRTTFVTHPLHFVTRVIR